MNGILSQFLTGEIQMLLIAVLVILVLLYVPRFSGQCAMRSPVVLAGHGVCFPSFRLWAWWHTAWFARRFCRPTAKSRTWSLL